MLSSTLFNDDGHYSDVHISGGAARIPAERQPFIVEPGHHDYPDVSQMSIGDNGTVEPPASSSGAYDGLDPAALAELRQPPAPSVYASLGITDPSQDVHDANSDGGHPGNYDGLDPASLNERPMSHEYAGIIVHPNVIELTTNYSGAEHPASAAYQGLDPAALAELRQPPAASVYASLRVTDAGQDVQDANSDGGHPASYEGLDPARLNEHPLPLEYAGISGTTRASGSAANKYLELIFSPQDNDDD